MPPPPTPDTPAPVETGRPTAPPTPASPTVRPLGGVAAGVGLVLLAVLAGMIGQHTADTGTTTSSSTVPATGHTTTIAVTATGMRYHPDRLTVPAGDRLIIELTNTDSRRHDLVLADGPRTPLLSKGDTARLDAGIVGGTVQGWCSQPAHRWSRSATPAAAQAGGRAGGRPAAGAGR